MLYKYVEQIYSAFDIPNYFNRIRCIAREQVQKIYKNKRLKLHLFNSLLSRKASIELMYDDEEVHKQNGAKLIQDLPVNEELQKRSDAHLKKRSAPQFWDGRYAKGSRGSPIIVNTAVTQDTCGNCYLHVFVAALELAYAKATGQVVKFSEQEMTDCYENGCEGGDYRMVGFCEFWIFCSIQF